jgi:hypothetical protein
MNAPGQLVVRAHAYCQAQGLVMGQRLGYGVHGSVSAVENQANGDRSAIKGFERELEYRRERDIYLRLQEHGVTVIRSCAVPVLIRYDDNFWVIEMTVVTRPFILDFAGAYLEFGPDFSDEVMAEWQAEKQEQFQERWPEVQRILAALEGYGIFMVDVHPGNISFGD